MHLLSATTALASLLALAEAVPTPVSHVLHEKRDHALSGWTKRAPIESGAVIPIRIGLTQNNLESGYDLLMDVSHPTSPRFGKHWSADEVHSLFAPSSEAVEVVRSWLVASGIAHDRIVHSDNKGWLAFDGTVEEAKNLFQTEYYEHEHVRHGEVRIGCDEYHVPEHIQAHVDYVTPGVTLSAPVKKSIVKRGSHIHKSPLHQPVHGPPGEHHHWPGPIGQLPEDLRACGQNITPTCIRALYHIPNGTLDVKNALGIYEQGDYYAQGDLNSFFAAHAPWVPQGTGPILHGIDGGKAPVPVGSPLETGESVIDFDLAFSLTYPQKIILYQVDDQIYSVEEIATVNTFNTFLDALDGSYCNYTAYGITGDTHPPDAVYPDPAPGGYKGKLQCGVYKPTTVISASYGQSEQDVTANYAKRQCNEFMKLSLQGHSIFISSGDYGVASFPNDPDADGCLGPEGNIFNPQYPCGCPYHTSVGATRLYWNQTILDRESTLQANLSRTAQNFSTSGGFSNYFTPPAYQAKAVAQFLENHNPPYPYYEGSEALGANGGLYNRSGRGYPDVAANGAELLAYVGGNQEHWYGTSLAAPIWASIITLINNERSVAGKGPVGFVNPTLYENPWVLNDIVNGSNPGCGTEGFGAHMGWDPSTGLGTPSYPRLLELFMRLP